MNNSSRDAQWKSAVFCWSLTDTDADAVLLDLNAGRSTTRVLKGETAGLPEPHLVHQHESDNCSCIQTVHVTNNKLTNR